MFSKKLIPASEILESKKLYGEGNFIKIEYKKRNLVSYNKNVVVYLKSLFRRVSGEWVVPQFAFKNQVLGSGAKLPYGVDDLQNDDQVSKVKELSIIIRSFDELEIKNFSSYSEMNDKKIMTIVKNCKLNADAALALANEYTVQCKKFNKMFLKQHKNGDYISIKSIDNSITAKYTNMLIRSPVQKSYDDQNGDAQSLKHPLIRLKLRVNKKNNNTISFWYRSNECVPIVFDLSKPMTNGKGYKVATCENSDKILDLYNANKFITVGSISSIIINSSDISYSSQGISPKFIIKKLSMFSNPKSNNNSDYGSTLEEEFGEDILKVLNKNKEKKENDQQGNNTNQKNNQKEKKDENENLMNREITDFMIQN